MMQHTKFKYGIILGAIILLAYTSCQKVIDLKLNNAATQLVIEGNLTDQLGDQYVIISNSVAFSATDNFPPVTGADVAISDSTGEQFKLTEKFPGVYSFTAKGVYGQTYTLTVKTGGKVYTATSTMPNNVLLDSVTAKIADFGKKDLRTIVVNYQDPPNIANQYLFLLFINSEEISTIFTNNDSFIDGRYQKQELFQTGSDIRSGDTARVEMESIDKNIYKYWFSLSQQQNNGPGGGITPSNPPSNFNNGALGYFSAHTVNVSEIIVY